jgi:copper chaperone CopZ
MTRLVRCGWLLFLAFAIGVSALPAMALGSPSLQAVGGWDLATASLAGVSGGKPFVAEGRADIGEGGIGPAGKVAYDQALVNAVLKAVTEVKGQAWVEANRDVVGAELLSDPRPFLIGVPEAKAPAIDPVGKQAIVVVSATVDMALLREAIEGLGTDGSKVRYPRTLVAVTEEIIRRPAPDPAAETAIKDVLTGAGVPVVDVQGMDDNRRRSIADALRQGQTDAAEGLQKEFRCEIILVGEAFAEEGPPELGMVRCEARVEVKAYYADTAQLLCAKSATAPAVRPTVLIAGKEALRAAGEKVGHQVLDTLSTGRTTLIQVHVTGCRSFRWLTDIQAVLEAVGGVNTVERRAADIANGVGAWDVVGPGATAEAIAQALHDCVSPRLRVMEATGHAVTAEVSLSHP